MIFEKNDTKKEIIKKIVIIQSFLERQRYITKDYYVGIKDSVDKKVLDVWIEYGNNSNYRRIFGNKIYNLWESGEISITTFNMLSRRFYEFNRNEPKMGDV